MSKDRKPGWMERDNKEPKSRLAAGSYLPQDAAQLAQCLQPSCEKLLLCCGFDMFVRRDKQGLKRSNLELYMQQLSEKFTDRLETDFDVRKS